MILSLTLVGLHGLIPDKSTVRTVVVHRFPLLQQQPRGTISKKRLIEGNYGSCGKAETTCRGTFVDCVGEQQTAECETNTDLQAAKFTGNPRCLHDNTYTVRLRWCSSLSLRGSTHKASKTVHSNTLLHPRRTTFVRMTPKHRVRVRSQRGVHLTWRHGGLQYSPPDTIP